SLLANIPGRRDAAMTGAVNLSGRGLAIGGLKEKILAAKRATLSTVILPKRNEKDLEEIPKHLLRGIQFVFAETMDDVIKASLREAPPQQSRRNQVNSRRKATRSQTTRLKKPSQAARPRTFESASSVSSTPSAP